VISNQIDSPAVFQARDLRVSFDAVEVLKSLNLTIHQGEVVAILGANGSGKSTLIRALVRINHPNSGTVISPDPRQIGFVPQRANSGGGISATALEVVASGLLGKGRIRLPRGWRSQALAALNQVGLADRAGTAVVHLSGGQQQRVYIARALVRKPQVLVLDEPLAGVDAASQQQLAETLANLVRTGITIVVVLHELGALAPLITRAIVLDQGEIVADGPPSLTSDIHAPTHATVIGPTAQSSGHSSPTGHSVPTGYTGHQEDEITQIVTLLGEHETGFPGLDPQIQGLTTRHVKLPTPPERTR